MTQLTPEQFVKRNAGRLTRIDLTIPEDGPACDFCATKHPTWMYPAKNFYQMIGPKSVFESDGGWASCDTCRELIEADRWDDLACRAMVGMGGKLLDIPNPETLEFHVRFRAARTGPAVRI